MTPDLETYLQLIRRRTFLGRIGAVGRVALLSMLQPAFAGRARATNISDSNESTWKGVVDPPHVTPRVKRVIHLYMAGGPSQFETFDHKPELARRHDQPMPPSFTKGQPIAQLQGHELRCFAPQFSFSKFGSNCQEICSLFPHLGSIADDLCIVRSMTTDAINHDPAHTVMNTGTTIPGRPSMGSWILYGLGSLGQDLPGFVVLTSVGKGGEAQPIANRQWHSGFLPSRFQGVEFHSTGSPVLYIENPPGVSRQQQQQVVSSLGHFSAEFASLTNNAEVAQRISQYELAFRMQASVPELVDVSGESQSTMDMYGAEMGDGSFASNCLLARRMAERGVRFVQIYHRAWDHHGAIKKSMEITAKEVDQACAALITDLKQRGMYDDTLIIWSGEFGRTPMAQPRENGRGRDHHIKSFSMFLSGGAVRGGITYGGSDELGYNAVENPTHVRDLHATLLYLLGIDDKKFSVRFQGLDTRLTGVLPARVVKEILS